MDKCNCWEQYLKCGKDCKYDETVGFCVIMQRECSCEGDKSKCDFSSENPVKRNEIETMNTAEMWMQAQENGKTYQLMNEKVKIYYRKDRGIFDSDGYHVAIDRLGEIDTFMNRHWQETTPILTKSEAEAKFGIKIVG